MNQNSIQEETENRLKSVPNSSSSSLLSKNIKIKKYRNTILPVILYGYETWSLTLREECRLWVLENRVLRRLFGPKRDEVTGKWRKLNNEELNDLYSSSNIIWLTKLKRMRWAGHVALWGRGEVPTGFLWENLRERDQWGDPDADGRIILRWIFRQWDREYMDWTDLAQDRDRWRALVNMVMNL